MLLRPKGAAKKGKSARKTEQDSAGTTTTTGGKRTAQAGSKRGRSKGKTAGTLKSMTKEERRAEVKRRRAEEKQRRRELKRQERERRRMLRGSRRSRKGTRSRKGQFYVVKAIVSLGSESYALIDGRRAQVGDVVMGRKVVAIEPDRIEVESFGRRTTVRVGESLLPSGYGGREPRSRRRR
jgi:hypothetical protein